MPTIESKLKKILNKSLVTATTTQKNAVNGLLNAQAVAFTFVNTINEIISVCEERKRY